MELRNHEVVLMKIGVKGAPTPATPNRNKTCDGGFIMANIDVSALDWVDTARFWSRVETGPVSQCWSWTGGKDQLGYGFVKLRGNTHGAHRVAYALATDDPPPSDQVVRHKCDNPSCVNPSHLIIGTHADNVADRVRRRRSAFGSKSGRAKLTESQVLQIADDERTAEVIANQYGVSKDTIHSIRERRTWKHLWGKCRGCQGPIPREANYCAKCYL